MHVPTQMTYLFKNNVDPERSRQMSTFTNPDIMKGFAAQVARATKGLTIDASECRGGGCSCAAGC
jgi:hypothetical protein